MSDPKDKRQFSAPMRDANSAFLPTQERTDQPFRVGFVVLEHFSMMAFTAAVDALVTANLVRTAPLFEYSTYGLERATVKSDLGIDISTTALLDQVPTEGADKLDILIVCGGFRCSLAESPALNSKLKAAARNGSIIGSLWNGAVALGHAGLLDDKVCALHPDNHALMRETFPRVTNQAQHHHNRNTA